MPATTPRMSSKGIPTPRPTPRPTFAAVDMPLEVLWFGEIVVVFPIPMVEAVGIAEVLVDDAEELVAEGEVEILK